MDINFNVQNPEVGSFSLLKWARFRLQKTNGLEPFNVNLWMYKKLAIYFIPKSVTHVIKGQTITNFEDNPKILYFRIILDGKEISEPSIYFGVLKDFIKKGKTWPEKIEQYMTNIEYIEERVFVDYEKIDYEDSYISYKGKLSHVDLYDIKTSEDISNKLIKPALKMYRET